MDRFGGPVTEWGVIVANAQGNDYVLIDHFDNSHGADSWRRSHPHPVFSADGKRIYFNVSSGPWTQLNVAERRATDPSQLGATGTRCFREEDEDTPIMNFWRLLTTLRALLFVLLFVVGMFVLVTTEIYKEMAVEAACRREFGLEWKEHYERHFGPGSLSEAHEKIAGRVIGVLVILTIVFLIYRNLAGRMNARTAYRGAGEGLAERQLHAPALFAFLGVRSRLFSFSFFNREWTRRKGRGAPHLSIRIPCFSSIAVAHPFDRKN